MKTDDPQYVSILSMNDQGPAPEAAIVRDIIKHGSIVAPILIGLSAVFWGVNGAWSGAFGIVLVLGTFAVAAWMVSYTPRVSYTLKKGATLDGYDFRIAVMAAGVVFVSHATWDKHVPL